MKVSVSLPEQDVAFLDEYATTHGMRSRSAALKRAVELLRAERLEAAYEDAWDTWATTGEAEVWEVTVADGLGDP